MFDISWHFARNETLPERQSATVLSSLTRAIKRLEEELGGSLFHRDRVNTCLTDLGIHLRSDLARIERSAADAKRKAAKMLFARLVTHQPRPMEAFMRLHHVLAVVAVLIIGIGAKWFLFPPQQADANINAVASGGINVLQMQRDIDVKNLPQQKMNDRTFVFADED